MVKACLSSTMSVPYWARDWEGISLLLCCLRPLLESPTWPPWGSLDFLWIRVFWDSGRGSCQSARPWGHDFCCILLVKALIKPAQNLEEAINPSSKGKHIKEFVTVSNPNEDSKQIQPWEILVWLHDFSNTFFLTNQIKSKNWKVL